MSEPSLDDLQATIKRDDDIVGWEIRLKGQVGAFHVQDRHLKDMAMTIEQYVKWLRQTYPGAFPRSKQP